MHHSRARHALIAALALLASCTPRPSGDEALQALHAVHPAVDTTRVFTTVWRDGPPWFSCAEIRAKLRRQVVEPAVRDTLASWQSLARAGWMSLRDTAAGEVTDPGWCKLVVADSVASRVRSWATLLGDSFPAGGRRRGWIVSAGTRELVLLSRPRPAGRDSATVEYGIVVDANEHGAAVGADRDTSRHVALLHRAGGQWRVIGTRPSERDH